RARRAARFVARLIARCRGRRRSRCRGRRSLLEPEVLPQGEPAAAHFARFRAPDVAEMPRLVGVAGDTGLALRVRHDKAVLPRVLLEPGTGLGRAPVGVIPGRRSAVAPEVHGGPELVLAVSGAGAR